MLRETDTALDIRRYPHLSSSQHTRGIKQNVTATSEFELHTTAPPGLRANHPLPHGDPRSIHLHHRTHHHADHDHPSGLRPRRQRNLARLPLRHCHHPAHCSLHQPLRPLHLMLRLALHLRNLRLATSHQRYRSVGTSARLHRHRSVRGWWLPPLRQRLPPLTHRKNRANRTAGPPLRRRLHLHRLSRRPGLRSPHALDRSHLRRTHRHRPRASALAATASTSTTPSFICRESHPLQSASASSSPSSASSASRAPPPSAPRPQTRFALSPALSFKAPSSPASSSFSART